jgi:hypothetical protein
MQDGAFDADSLEQIARDVGRRWGAELKAEYLSSGRPIANWPGTLGEARRLVDTVADRRLNDVERELLVLLVERGARRAWHSRDEVVPSSPTRSGVMLKPLAWGERDDDAYRPRLAGSRES